MRYENHMQKVREAYNRIMSENSANAYRKLVVSKFGAMEFPYEESLDECLAQKDWNGLNNMLYQDNKQKILPTSDSGYDHCWMFIPAITAIAVGDIETLERIMPENIGESKNGYTFYVVGINMLLALWYKNNELLQKAILKAEKFITSKKTQWERAAIAYLIDLSRNDVEQASVQLQTVCKSYMRADFIQCKKKLCVPAHGLYRLAFYLLKEDKFDELRMPEYKDFSKEYAAWKNENDSPLELYIKYPDDLSLVNKIYLQPAAICEIAQLYKDSDNSYLSNYEKNSWYMDLNTMLDKFIKDADIDGDSEF